MKKLFAILSVVCLVLALASVSFAADKSSSMTGWVTDEKCGAKDASADKAACAKACIGRGSTPVFVSDKDKEVMKVDNPDALKAHAGEHVKVKGSVKDGSLHVDSVSALSGKAS